MKISLLAVGRLKESYFKEAQTEYLKRLRPYCSLVVEEHKDDAALMDEDTGPITIPVMCNDYLAEQPTGITSVGVDGFSESEPTTSICSSRPSYSARRTCVTCGRRAR